MSIMDLHLNLELARGYKSATQRARVMTETWAEENLYCLSCSSDQLDPTRPSRKVVDFVCPSCEERYQLKSKSSPFGTKVSNSAYDPKIEAIRAGTTPNYVFLQYDRSSWQVRNLFAVPGHFITESVVEKRKELRPTARRAGWVGSNILLAHLPLDARVHLIVDGASLPKEDVRKKWQRFLFMRFQRAEERSWISDVLLCVRELDKEIFTLSEIYQFEKRLAKLHPRNKHIRPKIRQQLQILRDRGVIKFLDKGLYQIKKS